MATTFRGKATEHAKAWIKEFGFESVDTEWTGTGYEYLPERIQESYNWKEWHDAIQERVNKIEAKRSK